MNATESMENPSVISAAYFGDVTALALAEIPLPNGSTLEVIIGGIGSQLHVFSLTDCRHLCSQTVLPNAVRCHGVATCRAPHSTLMDPLIWIAVHGDRHVNILSLSPSNLTTLTPVAALPRLTAWTMSVKIFPLPGSSLNALVTVGLSNNSVEFYRINSEEGGERIERVQRVECTDRCLLYSMDLFFPLNKRASLLSINNDNGADSNCDSGICLVAGGTIFLDVVIWAARWSGTSDDGDHKMGNSTATAPVLYRLKGHEGSIHTVQWGPLGLTLASGSDDRTIRLWNIPSDVESGTVALQNTKGDIANGDGVGSVEEVLLQPRQVLYGHVARLWGSCFTPDESIVVSGSEDGTARFWDAGNGSCLRVLKAHRFRGVWHCLLRGSMLYTGGADGSIKAWNLWDNLEGDDVRRIISTFKGNFPNPEILQQTIDSLKANAVCSPPTAGRSIPIPAPDATMNVGAGYDNDSAQQHGLLVSDPQQIWELLTLRCTLPDPESTTVGAITLPPPSTSSSLSSPHSDLLSPEQTTHPPPPKKFDSTTEWIRCLALSKDHSMLFLATNRGLIHQIDLPIAPSNASFLSSEASGVNGKDSQVERKEERWTTLFKSERKRPFVTLNITEDEQWLRIGACDIMGYAVTLVKRYPSAQHAQHDEGEESFSHAEHAQHEAGEESRCKEAHSAASAPAREGWECQEWRPYENKAALAAYFIEGMGEDLILTTGPGGQLTLWSLPNTSTLPIAYASETNTTITTSSSSRSDGITDTAAAGPVVVADGALGIRRATLLVAVSASPVSVSSISLSSSSSGIAEEGTNAGGSGVSSASGPACFLPYKKSASASISEGKGTSVGDNASATAPCWLIATGTSWGGIVLWRLDLNFEARGADPFASRSTPARELPQSGRILPGGSLSVLFTVKEVHMGTPVRGISLRAVRGTAGAAGGRLEVESSGSNGTLVRFAVGQGGKLDILQEDRYDSVLIIAGKAGPKGESAGTTRATAEKSDSTKPEFARSELVYGFQTTNFVVWDEAAEAEVCSLHCSSWRRPWAAHVAAADDLTFCCNVGANDILIYTRRPPQINRKIDTSSSFLPVTTTSPTSASNFSTSAATPALQAPLVFPHAFMPPSHGREINAVCLLGLTPPPPPPPPFVAGPVLETPTGSSSDHNHDPNKLNFTSDNNTHTHTHTLLCVTGGEDASVRQAVIEIRPGSNGNGGGLMRDVGLISDHVGGNSVKAIAHAVIPNAAIPTSTNITSTSGTKGYCTGRKSLVVAGGSRQAMMAWVVTHQKEESDGRKCESDGFDLEKVDKVSDKGPSAWDCELLSTHASPAVFSVKNLPEGQPPLTVEMRYLSLSILFSPSTPTTDNTFYPYNSTAFVLAAASNGLVDIFAVPLDPGSRGPSLCNSWQQVATLEYHASPVLSVQSLVLSGRYHVTPSSECTDDTSTGSGTGSGSLGKDLEDKQFLEFKERSIGMMHRCVAFSAGTDGSLAVWDLSSCIEEYLQATAGTAGHSRSSGGSSGVSPSSWKSTVLKPIAVFSGVHQSGVNGMSAAQIPCGDPSPMPPAVHAEQSIKTPSSCLPSPSSTSAVALAEAMVVTVGDDQALCASLLCFQWVNSHGQKELGKGDTNDSSMLCTLRCQTREPNAHSSAARDVWTDGFIAYSVGLDQKVRQWKLEVQKKEAQGAAELQSGGSNAKAGAVCNVEASGGDGVGGCDCVLEIIETGCIVTQVLEPAAVDVAPAGREGGKKSGSVGTMVAVAGRGLQVLDWR